MADRREVAAREAPRDAGATISAILAAILIWATLAGGLMFGSQIAGGLPQG